MPEMSNEILIRALKLITTAASNLAISAKDMGGQISGLDQLDDIIMHIIVARDIYERLPSPRGRELQHDLNRINAHLDKAHGALQKRSVIVGAEACLDALRTLKSHWY